ncbi:MAG: hypothetical protein QGG42_00775 [Phycisphaerae bacterium]|nr:hypothetical protein [Phycisphaerae bacterium]
MTEGIVDVLEAVEVQEHKRQFLSVSPGLGDGLFKSVLKKHAIRKFGQGVVVRQEVDPLVGGFALGHVRGYRSVVHYATLVVPHLVNAQPLRENLAVLPAVPYLALPGALG